MPPLACPLGASFITSWSHALNREPTRRPHRRLGAHQRHRIGPRNDARGLGGHHAQAIRHSPGFFLHCMFPASSPSVSTEFPKALPFIRCRLFVCSGLRRRHCLHSARLHEHTHLTPLGLPPGTYEVPPTFVQAHHALALNRGRASRTHTLGMTPPVCVARRRHATRGHRGLAAATALPWPYTTPKPHLFGRGCL